MKTLLLLTTSSLFGLTALVSADCKGCEKGKCDATTCAKEGCSKEGCKDGCACDTTAKAGTENVHFAVTGMTCDGCSKKVTADLSALEGVTVKKVCHKSGCTIVNFDTTKTTKEKIQQAITTSGFKVVGEKLSIPVTGMTCDGCTKTLTKALTALEGCTVGTVCHKSGHAEVLIDSAKTNKAKVVETINTAGFKAVVPKPTPVPTPVKPASK